MKALVLLLLCVAPLGCTTFTQAQINLVTQARRGVVIASEHQTVLAQSAQKLSQLRRQRLDEAFDADVMDQQELSVDWVIEHRKAYAVALDAYSQESTAAQQAQIEARENLEAVDAALQRLQWLQSIQYQLVDPKELRP